MAGVRRLSMLPELATGRLTIRLAQPGLEGPMARFLRDNWEGHLDRWNPPTPPGFFTEAFWAERLEYAVREFHNDRSARFVLQEAGAGPEAPLVGTANYTNFVRGAFQACNLGYQASRGHQGRGLMAEGLAATNRYVFASLRMHRIMANYIPTNERSRRLAARLGFVEEGFARNYLFIDGAWRDHVLSALENPDFDPGWILGATPAPR